jgi:hypothetical protein
VSYLRRRAAWCSPPGETRLFPGAAASAAKEKEPRSVATPGQEGLNASSLPTTSVRATGRNAARTKCRTEQNQAQTQAARGARAEPEACVKATLCELPHTGLLTPLLLSLSVIPTKGTGGVTCENELESRWR